MISGTDPDAIQQRMFTLWSALQKAVWESGEALGPEPWESRNDKVRAAWDELTRPSNLEGLELWAGGDLNATARAATDRALWECKSRARDSA
jgi:hypothetical protein